MDAFRLYEATGVLTDFVDALSNWYVRRNRDRFWAPGLDADKLDVHWTLYECLVELAKLLAPFLPFATEEMWQNLVRQALPRTRPRRASTSATTRSRTRRRSTAGCRAPWARVRDLVSLGLQVRTAQQAPRAAAPRGGGDRPRRSGDGAGRCGSTWS